MEQPQIFIIIISVVQVLGLPIALFIIKYVRKGYFSNKYNSMQTEAIVFTMEKYYGNGFGECYRAKLNELKDKANWVKSQAEM
jgi:ABC-type thiamin/hydroxymethylpyrimidine transport system permease subunit